MSDIVLNLIHLAFIGLTETWYVHFSLSKLMTRNSRSTKAYMAALAVYLICTIYDAANDFRVYFVFLLAYFLIAAVSLLFYEGSLGIRLGISFVSIALNYSATILSCALVSIIKGEGVDAFPMDLSMDISTEVLMIAFCIPFVLAISSFGKKLSGNFKSMLIAAFIIPLAMFLLILRQFYLNQLITDARTEMSSFFIIAALLMLAATMLYSLTMLNSSLLASLNYSATLEQMVAMQEKYYADLQNHQSDLRRINHDMKNHTRTIAKLMESGQYEEASKYTKTIMEDVSSITAPVTNCDNQLINALLNAKLDAAKENGVELSLCVMVPAVLKITSVDVSILLGNILDNAVEACAKMPADAHKFIDADIRLAGMFLSVAVSNSYTTPVKMQHSKYVTTKKDAVYHGIGLSNIKRVVDKYSGKLIINHENNVFTVSALLTYPEE